MKTTYEKVSETNDMIKDAVKKSNKAKVGVYQKSDWLGNIGLVFIMDDVPSFIIDFVKPVDLPLSEIDEAIDTEIWEYEAFEKFSTQPTFYSVVYWFILFAIEMFGVESYGDFFQLRTNFCRFLQNGPHPGIVVLQFPTPIKIKAEDINSLLEKHRSWKIRDYHFIESNCKHFVENTLKDLNPDVDLNEIKAADEIKLRGLNTVVGIIVIIVDVLFYHSLPVTPTATSFIIAATQYCIPWFMILIAGIVLGRRFEMGKEVIYALKLDWKKGLARGVLLGIFTHILIHLLIEMLLKSEHLQRL